MAYTVGFKASAGRSIEALPKQIQLRVMEKAEKLAADPRPPNAVKLKGCDLWRVRVGEYRIVYLVDDDRHAIDVRIVAHRREVYRDL